MSVSCLVVSRTADLLNRLLTSLPQSHQQWRAGDDILCSWNGSAAEEAAIDSSLGPCPDHTAAFRIAQRCPITSPAT